MVVCPVTAEIKAAFRLKLLRARGMLDQIVALQEASAES